MIEAAIASMAGFLERIMIFYRDCAKDFRAFPVGWTKPCAKALSGEGYYPPPFSGGSPCLASSPGAGLSSICLGSGTRVGHADLDPLDAAWVGVHHFEFDAVLDNDFAAHRNMPREGRDEPPQGIDLLGVADRGEIGVDRAENLAKIGTRVDDEISVRGGFDLRAFAEIVFVLDIADNHFHDVLDRR